MKYLNYRLSAAMWARVLLLWLALGIGALVVGGVALGLGRFMQDNIRTELASQQISFNTLDKMTDEEKKVPGMVENAGQPLTTGNQAKVYSELMALHVHNITASSGYPDATYATLGGTFFQLQAALKAVDPKDQTALAAAQAKFQAVSDLRNTLQTASTLRGNLLAAYGWDNVASGIIATGAFMVVLAVLFFGLFFYEWRRGHLPPTEA